MADKDYHLDDDLLDDVEEMDDDVEEAHDPMNAEKKSVDSVDKAAKTGPSAKKRPQDKTNQENGGKPYKADKGIVREMYAKMQEMTAEELRALHSVLMDDEFDADSLTNEDTDALEDVSYDMSEDISDLVESEATLSEEFKGKAATIMEMAVKTKLRSEIARLEEAYEEQIEEGLTEAKEEMVEMINSYLNYVVENWMEENAVAINTGLRTEIAENFMTGLKDLFEESYIEVPEEKVDLVDDLAEKVESLEAELNGMVESHMTMSEELEEFKRDAIVLEFADDLADTQLDKLAKLTDAVDFDDEDTFRDRVSTIKETYFGKGKDNTATNRTNIHESADGDDDDAEVIETSGSMSRYLTALDKTAVKS